MYRFGRRQVENAPTEAQVITDDEGRYDNTPTHREAIRAVVKYAALTGKRHRIHDASGEALAIVRRSEATESALSHRASTNRWSQEIIWSSVFVGFIFDFLLWQDIFTGRFELGALSLAAERASAVVCSLAYAYVCSQVGIAASIRVAAIRRQRGRDQAGDHTEREVFARAAARASFSLWTALFVLLTGVSTLGRFTQDGTTEDHALLTLVAVAIALVIAVMAYQYHDIYAHDLRKAKSTGAKAQKRLDLLFSEMDGTDLLLIEQRLNASLLSCSCGRHTCPVPETRSYFDLPQAPTDDKTPTEVVEVVEAVADTVNEPPQEPTEVVEVATEPEGEDGDVVLIKNSFPTELAPQSDDRKSLIDDIAAKAQEIEKLRVESRYWKSKARQYKAKHAKLDDLLGRLVGAVLDQGSEPMFYRRIMTRHRREWAGMWRVLDEILAEYGDGIAAT